MENWPVSFSVEGLENNGSTNAQIIELTMVSGEFTNNNNTFYKIGEAVISNLANVYLPDNYPIETTNCTIINVKRQIRSDSEPGSGFENPAILSFNLYKKSKKFIFTIKANNLGTCSIKILRGKVRIGENLTSDGNSIFSKETSFTWTYKKNQLVRNLFISAIIIAAVIKVSFKLKKK